MTNIIDMLISFILASVAVVMGFIAAVDLFLADMMTYAGIGPVFQVILLIVVALWLITLAVRVTSGFFSTLITLLLMLLVLHRLLPGLGIPQGSPPVLQPLQNAMHTST